MSAMAITAKDNPLLVIDICIPKQTASAASVDVDENDYADIMSRICDPTNPDRVEPINCQRIWIHTHPVGLVTPSGTDESTFKDSYGSADWAVMFILAKGGGVYAKMRLKVPLVGDVFAFLTPHVTHDVAFPAANPAEWQKELDDKVRGFRYAPNQFSAFGLDDELVVEATGTELPFFEKPAAITPPPTTTVPGVTHYGNRYTPSQVYNEQRSNETVFPVSTPLCYPENHPAYGLDVSLIHKLLATNITAPNGISKRHLKQLADRGVMIYPDKTATSKFVQFGMINYRTGATVVCSSRLVASVWASCAGPLLTTEILSFIRQVEEVLFFHLARRTPYGGMIDRCGERATHFLPWLCTDRVRLIILSAPEYDVLDEILAGRISGTKALELFGFRGTTVEARQTTLALTHLSPVTPNPASTDKDDTQVIVLPNERVVQLNRKMALLRMAEAVWDCIDKKGDRAARQDVTTAFALLQDQAKKENWEEAFIDTEADLLRDGIYELDPKAMLVLLRSETDECTRKISALAEQTGTTPNDTTSSTTSADPSAGGDG